MRDGFTGELHRGQCSSMSGWVVVMEVWVEWRVIAFGAPNLFDSDYRLLSHRIVHCLDLCRCRWTRVRVLQGYFISCVSPPLVLVAEGSHSLMGGSDDACP